MSEYGTLNGQPLGPELADPIPCERCGHPVWLGKDLIVLDVHDQPRELPDDVWELGYRSPNVPRSLTKHSCRTTPKVEEHP